MRLKKDLLMTSMVVIFGSLIGYEFAPHSMQPDLHKNVDLKIEQIWNHNIGVILLIIFGGIITFGLLSCIILFINGLSFGIVMANLPSQTILFVLVPYATLELSAFLVASLMSFYLSRKIKQALYYRQIAYLYKKLGYEKLFLATMFILLGVAAILEVYL